MIRFLYDCIAEEELYLFLVCLSCEIQNRYEIINPINDLLFFRIMFVIAVLPVDGIDL